MNENIGAKGGRKDRQRHFKILRRNKEKLSKEELEALEKKVKKRQIINIFTLVPIAIIGAVTATVTGLTIAPSRRKDYKDVKKEKSKEDELIDLEVDEPIKEEKKTTIKIEKEIVFTKQDEEKLEDEISKIKSIKIIEEYEERLKELRYKLKNNYYEKSIIEEVKSLEDNPSSKNLDKINILIDKLDNYKENITINTTFLVEENYIKELVNEDIKNIKEESILVEESKSDLFKSIDSKVEEIKKIESTVKEDLEQQKVWKNIDEEKLEEIKEKDLNIEKHKNDLIKFQDEEDKINKVVQEKLKKEVNIFERERIQLSGMSIGSALAIKNIRHNTRGIGVRSGRKVFNFITTYLYYFSMIKAIKPIKNRYKKLNLDKYQKVVETSLEEIDKVLSDIKRTSNKLEKTIKEFMTKYERYSNTNEYKNILDNLLQMEKALKEKEYEIEQIKKKEEKKYQNTVEENKVYKL
ncbi:MAG: hypothetical protein Q4E69_06525 [Bacilli bacterium]|nr:hypothetical protein [Bacilli bacterium]